MGISMAKPFVVDPRLSRLTIPFPSSDELRIALSGSERRTRETVVRLWLTEGFPHAFSSCPAIYEDIRGWLGYRLSVHPKEINLIGSARLGYSLAPPPRFGKPFGGDSDLDLSVISAGLFERLVAAFELFAGDYTREGVVPRNDRERTLWEENLTFGKRNIPLGFFDASKLPTFNRYVISQQINQAMWMLLKKLEVTPGAPKVSRASTRVYRDWRCLVDRVSLNLRSALPAA